MHDTKESNWDFVVKQMKAQQYSVVDEDLDASSYGLAQRRVRLYATFVDVLGHPQHDLETKKDYYTNMLMDLQVEMTPLTKTLLDLDHSRLLKLDPKFLDRASRAARTGGKWKKDWKVIKKKFNRRQVTLHNKALDMLDASSWGPALHQREKASIAIAYAKCLEKETDNIELVFEALHSYSRFCYAKGMTPTLLPSSKMWLLRQERPIMGVEAMMLQGLTPSKLAKLYPNSLFWSLAGNAFCAPVAVAVLMTSLTTFDY